MGVGEGLFQNTYTTVGHSRFICPLAHLPFKIRSFVLLKLSYTKCMKVGRSGTIDLDVQ